MIGMTAIALILLAWLVGSIWLAMVVGRMIAFGAGADRKS